MHLSLFSCNLVKILNLGNTFQSVQLLKHKLVATAPWSPGVCSYCPCGSIPFLDSHAPLSSGHCHNSGCLWSLELHHSNHLLLLLLLLLPSLAHVQSLFLDHIPPGHSSWVIGICCVLSWKLQKPGGLDKGCAGWGSPLVIFKVGQFHYSLPRSRFVLLWLTFCST